MIDEIRSESILTPKISTQRILTPQTLSRGESPIIFPVFLHFHLSFPKNLKEYDKIDNFRLKSRLYQELYREENPQWYRTTHRICSQKNIKNLICDRINKIKSLILKNF